MRQFDKKGQMLAKLIPSPGGKVAPEGGRKRNAGRNSKISNIQRPVKKFGFRTEVLRSLNNLENFQITARIPLQSPPDGGDS